MAWVSSSLDNDFFFFFFKTCSILGTVQKAICPLLPAHADISGAAVQVALCVVLKEGSEAVSVMKQRMTFFFSSSAFCNIYKKEFFSFGKVWVGQCSLFPV